MGHSSVHVMSSNDIHKNVSQLEQELELYRMPDIEVAAKISAQVFADMLLLHRWKEIDSRRKGVRIFQLLAEDMLLYQINLPFDEGFFDRNSAVLNAAKVYADFEDQTVKQVLVELALKSQKVRC